ncbi:sensor histidine kinase [Mariprofundus ferrooxydans]|uniref:histidine kinase n=1 Tax=Mariprofundus ferrooxydans PV-1 TaxID=314345 RepID=Q0F1M5_9PROT|nr:ATP-binding protein [Mariprofundus ferrooxydans]EAU55166.1 sensor histidine kinase [Mariprofundus ferrooxydans PV-1]
MNFLRGLSGVVALWLLAVFFMMAFVGWHQLRDISTIHDRALHLESVNHKSHILHELEMSIRKQAAFVHDFLINGSDQYSNLYRASQQYLGKEIDDAASQGIEVSHIRSAVHGVDEQAEKIFSLPFATGNMEGPILMQELDKKLADLSSLLVQQHHDMDDSVNDAMRLVEGLHLDLREDFAVSLLVLFALLAGLTVYMYTRMIRPLLLLRSSVAKIGEGELTVHCPEFGNNELGDLSRALNAMGESIREHQNALVRARSLQSHQEKMQALGLMAANIAHEVGNPLAAASVSLDVAGRKLKNGKSSEAEADLQIVSDELRRTEAIIRNILEFGRPSQAVLEAIDLTSVVGSSIQLVGLVRKARHVNLEYRPQPGIGSVSGSEDMLRQVLVNLLLNAIDASPEGALVRINAKSQDGMIWLDVSDQGRGIDSDHVEAVFSPMFSTKQRGDGTGLGLSISRDLIRQMDGDLVLFANSPEGCTFRITLPVAKEGDEHADSGY